MTVSLLFLENRWCDAKHFLQHLLPPNLLKLFAARPPLPYVRPIDNDVNVVRPKHLTGVAGLLAQVREENVAGLVDKGKADEEAGALTEDDSKFTLAEETRREIRREEKKKRKEEDFKNAVATCEPLYRFLQIVYAHLFQINRQKIPVLKVILIKHCSSLVWLVLFLSSNRFKNTKCYRSTCRISCYQYADTPRIPPTVCLY